MKRTVCIIVVLVAVASMPLFADPPVPIAYSNEVKTIRYDRTTGCIHPPGDTNMVIGWETESTNAPAAIIHVVTFGVGTNALFRMWTIETLKELGEPWRIAEWLWYEDATWITRP
ncbi:hypothetical protein [Thiocapsa sp. N5-Cardenillas]|uniref:hypothetical protein n=1 Tax=Thiocapsa sp. N5-Cardenillas TaxID=3137397 RepID=UPI0035AF140F